MKAIVNNIVFPLLLILSVTAFLVWLLPVKVTLFIAIVLQLLMLVAFGTINQQTKDNHGQGS